MLVKIYQRTMVENGKADKHFWKTRERVSGASCSYSLASSAFILVWEESIITTSRHAHSLAGLQRPPATTESAGKERDNIDKPRCAA